MKTAKQAEFQAKMRRLQAEYLVKLKQRLKNTLKLRDTLLNSMLESGFDELHREVHSVAGSGGSYGYHQVSEVARALEIKLKTIKNELPVIQWQAALSQLTEDFAAFQTTLEDVLNQRESGESPTRANPPRQYSELVKRDKDMLQQPPPPLKGEALTPADNVEQDDFLMLVEDDVELARTLSLQLQAFGYAVKTLHRAMDIYAALQQKPLPKVLLIDITLPEGETAGPEAVINMHHRMKNCRVPVIYISARDDAKARLSAVRGCGRAYLTKPVDVSLLVEWLDTLTERSLEAPYKVLLVDDDGNLCQHHALFLEQAGLITRICNKAIDMLDILRDFNPDVVLLDMYMPEYQGQELAMMIRQLDNYSSLPIVYLSTENMERVQLEAMLQGGDDFLTKPINPEILIRVINYRAMRYRQIRSLMTRDSLTRLLNHRHIKETLAYEINRAKREENACSLLMIDIDFFKQVNDTHGHSTGDQVLKTISRFLRQRLRTTDIIGRYGGEEFACVLPNTTTESAYLVATDLCRNFASIEHHGPESSFHLTFSCGIASYPDYVTAEELSEAADQALYSAKRNGRNRVEVAAI